MLPGTKSGRRFFAGASLLAATLLSALAVRGSAPGYLPEVPEFRAKGPKDAPVVIAEFSDFQCPACRTAVEPLQSIQRLFPGKVRVVFVHFPWDFHPWAKPAAIAAECAGRRDLFWPYHDKLYETQGDWAAQENGDDVQKRFLKIAGELGIGEEGFAACLNDPELPKRVDAEFAEARQNWVNSTPTFFINGKRFVGAVQLRTAGLNRIEDILK